MPPVATRKAATTPPANVTRPTPPSAPEAAEPAASVAAIATPPSPPPAKPADPLEGVLAELAEHHAMVSQEEETSRVVWGHWYSGALLRMIEGKFSAEDKRDMMSCMLDRGLTEADIRRDLEAVREFLAARKRAGDLDEAQTDAAAKREAWKAAQRAEQDAETAWRIAEGKASNCSYAHSTMRRAPLTSPHLFVTGPGGVVQLACEVQRPADAPQPLQAR